MKTCIICNAVERPFPEGYDIGSYTLAAVSAALADFVSHGIHTVIAGLCPMHGRHVAVKVAAENARWRGKGAA